uniref:Uncharacterized protein n=1 Tax=Biomphalaria glabrata TaxID=6526 RepID=A0A2C9KEU2_BIOGL
MDPSKDGARHGTGVGVEMTMSLSGPPGFTRHTTVSSDNIPHYMSRQHQQKAIPGIHDPRSSAMNPRAIPVDSRSGGHGGTLGMGHDARITMDVQQQHQVRDIPRTQLDTRAMEPMMTKNAPPRLVAEVPQHHQIPLQHPGHRADSRSFPDPRTMMTQDKRGLNPDSRSSRETVLMGDHRSGQLSMSSTPSRAGRPQQGSMPPLTMNESLRGAYDSMEPGMTSYGSLSSVPGGPLMSPHGTVAGKQVVGSQNITGPQMAMPYSGQKQSRMSDSMVPSGQTLHHAPEHSLYLSGKTSSRTYTGNHQKLLPPGHYMTDMSKGPIDVKSSMGLNPSDQLSPQHRDLLRDRGAVSELREREVRYSSVPSPMSRNIQKSSLELPSNHMKLQVDSSEVRRQEEHLRKASSYSGPPQSIYKLQGAEPHASLSKAITYPLGVDVSHRGGQAPPSLTSHMSPHPSNVQPIGHSSYPSPQSLSERGIPYPMEQMSQPRLQKSVIRQSMSSEEVVWREGGYPPEPPKQSRPVYHIEDIGQTSKNVPLHISDHESSHPTLRDVGLPRMQGSISTGQPRIMYEPPKSSNYPDQRVQPSDRYTSSQRDYPSPRPTSIGRSSQMQQANLVLPQEERPVHNQQEKTVSALDLTKLPQGSSKPGDSPLDLTVKTKKRPADDIDNAEYDRMVSAAKRMKPDVNSAVTGLINQKASVNSVDMTHNTIWISSPSPRGPESYEPLASPSSYTAHASPLSTVQRQNKYGYSVDGRISADSRMTVDGRMSADARTCVDGRSSVESRSSTDGRTQSSPHVHGKFPMVPPQHGKIGSSAMVSDMVKHAAGNPPMLPLTTQLEKMKEDHRKQKMGSESIQNPYADPKRLYKDSLSPRSIEMVPGNANEVIVVRHPQQHYDVSPQQQHQHALQQHSYKQQQQQLHRQQSMDVHNQQLHQQQRQKPNEVHEIIELGMKDSSDPLQASRSFARSFSQSMLQQHQQQQQHQMYLQQRQSSLKEQMMPMQSYPNAQHVQYSKEQMIQQQVFSKQQPQSSMSVQHYQNSLYPMKQTDSGYYQKQSQPTKHTDTKSYKQTTTSSQNTLVGTQKWATQPKETIKSGYLQQTSSSGNYQSMKGMSSKSLINNHGAENMDNSKFNYTKTERPLKSDMLKATFPAAAGPLPVGGVREESRRALRRVSYPSTEPGKHSEGARKESTSSLPDKPAKNDIEVSISPQSKTELVSPERSLPSGNTDKNDDVLVEEKSSSRDTPLSHQKKSPNSVVSLDQSAPTPPGQFAIPLSVTIPQSTSPMITTSPSPAASTTPKSVGTNKACWSKKHMILNAVNKDESLKRIISNTARKHEAGGISAECKSRIMASSTCSPIPTSPKMPILSPHEDEGEVAIEEMGVRAQTNNDDPPTLAPIRRGQGKSSAPRVSNSSSSSFSQAGTSTGNSSTDNQLVKDAYKNNNNSHEIANNNSANAAVMDVPAGEMPVNAMVVRRCSIGATQPEHQQQSLSPASDDSQKSSSGNVTFPRAEVIRRKYYVGSNWGHMKNIPIANVAPFVHSRVEDEKSKQQKIEELVQLHPQGAAVSAPTYLVQSQDLTPDVKEDGPRIVPEDLNLKSLTDDPDKEVSQLLATSSKKEISTKKKKLTKLRVSSPTKMKDLEIISPSLEYTVLKTAEIDDLKSREKLGHSVLAKKSLENRMKYKHKIVREKNRIMKPKKLVKKRIQYVYDDDENEEHDDLFIEDDDEGDQDFDDEGAGDKNGKKTSKADAEAKIRDREERALRREQLRDQSEESTGRHSLTSSGHQTSKSKGKTISSGSKLKAKTKSLGKSKSVAGSTKNAARISRRRVSSTNQRAQELKHNAIVQRRNTGRS